MASTGMMTSCALFEKNSTSSTTKKEAVLPRDREQIQKQASLKTFNPEELSRGVITGDWAIEEVNGKPAVGETTPYIKFVPKEGRIYGNDGCNVINATYKCSPQDSTLSFGEIASTMRMCAKEGITDYEITAALANTSRYSWSCDGNTYYLYLYSRNQVPMMTLMHQNFDFLNGTWRVVTIDDEPIDNEDMFLVIDVDEGKLHGNTGCNILNGVLETDMESPNSISFQQIITTRMACPNPENQTRFLVALENASHAKPVDKDKVLLLDDRNQVVLTLMRK